MYDTTSGTKDVWAYSSYYKPLMGILVVVVNTSKGPKELILATAMASSVNTVIVIPLPASTTQYDPS